MVEMFKIQTCDNIFLKLDLKSYPRVTPLSLDMIVSQGKHAQLKTVNTDTRKHYMDYLP